MTDKEQIAAIMKRLEKLNLLHPLTGGAVMLLMIRGLLEGIDRTFLTDWNEWLDKVLGTK